jgi:hypothetical protein
MNKKIRKTKDEGRKTFKGTFGLLLVLFLATFCQSVHAETINLIFLYPGGQGSQQQAQPLLDDFSAALKKASGDKIQAKIYYFNDRSAGEDFITKQKPAGGILAEDLFASKGSSWGAEKLLTTLQLPSGDGTNQYFILGHGAHPPPATGPITLYSARPVEKDFLEQKLFPQLGSRLNLKTTPNVVGMLRKIGKGEETGWVLLDQFEQATIVGSKAPWAQGLKTEASSPKIDSAPWVIFTANGTPDQTQALKTALLKLSADGASRQTLEMLRLKGFR